MTLSLSNLTPTAAVDVVGVFDVNLTQVFPEGRPVKATVKEDATFFKHPLESGTERTDHIIFNPVEITLFVMLIGDQYRNTYQKIKQIFRDQTNLVIQTKTDTYENMYIQSMPHDESPEEYDAVIISIGLTETQVSTSVVTFQPSAQADTSTQDRGQQEPGTPTDTESSRGSTLSRVFS